jgi:predicted metalloenzyme YecM
MDTQPFGYVPNDHVSLRVSKEQDSENWHVQVLALLL